LSKLGGVSGRGNRRIKVAEVTRDRDHTFISETIVIDVATGRRLVRSSLDGPLLFSPDGKTTATGNDDGKVRIRDTASFR
jgi:WD40 repeat protein